MVFFKFIVCAAIIFFAGKRVARYADIIAEKTGLGGLWIGLILVSITTSLPELFTGIGSVVFVGSPDLTVGNLLGANSYNLLNIGTLDVLERASVPLLSTVSQGHLLTAIFSIIPVLLVILAILLSTSGVLLPKIGNLGIFSISIFASYLILTRVIYNLEKRKKIPNILEDGLPELAQKYGDIELSKAYLYFGIASSVIVACGIWLAYIGKEISVALHLSQSFVGSIFIGFATTLPEITVSVAALLIGAKEIAVANMVGSNLFNMTIIFINDVFYKAPILESVSARHVWTACIVMCMTAVVILAMVTKSKRKIFNVSWYVPVLFIIFILGVYFNFSRGN